MPTPLPTTDRAEIAANSTLALRVALITGDLVPAGAEKQMFLIVRSLAEVGVDVRVYSLRRGDFYERQLASLGIELIWFGCHFSRAGRLLHLLKALRAFNPHIIHSIHAYTNFYSVIIGKALGVPSVGGLRSDLSMCLSDHPRIGTFLLTAPTALVVNSMNALDQIRARGLVTTDRLFFLPNAIHVHNDGSTAERRLKGSAEFCTCVCVGRIEASKRVDLFLHAIALARIRNSSVRGVIVGDGAEMPRMREMANDLQLLPEYICFTGFHADVFEVLSKASVMVLCSESEGTPNVILEAMAAGLPIVTTGAGDAGRIVTEARSGFAVPCGDTKALADSIVTLAESAYLRSVLGSAGRKYVEYHHDISKLPAHLLSIYARVAQLAYRDRIRETPKPLISLIEDQLGPDRGHSPTGCTWLRAGGR